MNDPLERLEGQLAGLDLGISVMEIMVDDPDLDRTGADVARFYLARLHRKRCELWLEADTLAIAGEIRDSCLVADGAAAKSSECSPGEVEGI